MPSTISSRACVLPTRIGLRIWATRLFPVPVDALISEAYAQERLREIPKYKARSSAETVAATSEPIEICQKPGKPDTSHLTVVDKNRLVVSLTLPSITPLVRGWSPKEPV